MAEKYTKISATSNCNVKFVWIRLGLKNRFAPAIDAALKMVTEQGRLAFTRPLYRDLYDWKEARPKAIGKFIQNRKFMHNTTANLVEIDLKLNKQ